MIQFLGEVLYWYLVILAAGLGLGVASMFIGVALFIVRSLWLAAGKEPEGKSEESQPYTKLRQGR